MPVDAVISLQQLRCIKGGEGGIFPGKPDPYIWPVLIRIDDNTLATPSLVSVTRRPNEFARVIIKSNMSNGEITGIPSSVGILLDRFEDNLNLRSLILVVALFDADETPVAAVRSGYQAFSNELGIAIAEKLFDLSQADDEELEQIKSGIRERVRSRVRSAIKGSLTSWQKVRVALGTLNLDDEIDNDFKFFKELNPSTFTLTFEKILLQGGDTVLSNNFEIQGQLLIRPVRPLPVDPCQRQIDAVKAAQDNVDAIEDTIAALQEDLQSEGPLGKPAIIAQIKRLTEDLELAMDVLEDARKDLENCRKRKPIGLPDSPFQSCLFPVAEPVDTLSSN